MCCSYVHTNLVQVTFLHPHGLSNSFRYPGTEDIGSKQELKSMHTMSYSCIARKLLSLLSRVPGSLRTIFFNVLHL